LSAKFGLYVVAAWIGSLVGGEPEELVRLGLHANELARQSGDVQDIASSCSVLGILTSDQGDFAKAKTYHEEALRNYRESGNPDWPPLALNGLGHVAYQQSDLDAAGAWFDQALTELRNRGNTYMEGIVFQNLAKIARSLADYPRAAELFRRALALRWENSDRLGVWGCLQGLASVFVQTGRYEDAARLYGAAEALRESIGAPPQVHRARYDRAVASIRSRLGDVTFSDAWQTGRQTPLSETVNAAILDTTDQRASTTGALNARSGLTPRELEVLSLIRDGLSNREIGEALFVSERTAQTHVQHILDKLDVNTRAAAAARAVELGLGPSLGINGGKCPEN
jgi:non-specific serine/threonine protein kinase